MSVKRRFAMSIALAGAVIAVVGCGETVIDSAKTEDALKANLGSSLGEDVAAVECPSDVEVEKGKTFTCSVKLKKGETQTATLKILNEDADVSVTDLRGSNE